MTTCRKCGSTNRIGNGKGGRTRCNDCHRRLKREYYTHPELSPRRPIRTKEEQLAHKKAYMKAYLEEYRKRPEVRVAKAKRALAAYHSLDLATKIERYIGPRYGLSLDEYHAKFEENGERCAICREAFDIRHPNAKPHIDHDHTSLKVRGMLCGRCNRMIGLANEKPETLRAAGAYIERWRVA